MCLNSFCHYGLDSYNFTLMPWQKKNKYYNFCKIYRKDILRLN